ncbi:hypothetical protein GCM10022631_37460 [Deinococcus rubellus]|uniref:hypothetical protein n=1 Tax=Deinococcus rubellus TaxID=1889240 RepID=UPI0031F06208
MKLNDLRGQKTKKTAQRVRWYGGYRGFGKADLFVEKLSQYLRQHRLTDTVYAMRLEKRAKGEFYFFLTFETPWPNQLPDEVQERLDECPLLKTEIGPCEEDKLSTFLGHEVKVKALGHCLAYRVLRLDAAEDPFQVEAADVASALPHASGDQAEQLLWYLSALGQGRWPALRSACTALNQGDKARRLARSLRMLGHLEISADGERWSVTPPTTVQVSQPDGSALVYQLGARTPSQPGEMTTQRGGPPRLEMRGEGETDLLLNPALALCGLLPTLSEYCAGLSVAGGVSAVQHTFARFDGLRFTPGPFVGKAGLYEVTAKTGQVMTLLYSESKWLRGEWYGLRYLALHEAGGLLPARFDSADWRLALPADQRPPELYERALVLCSGLLPQWQGEWLIYTNVPPGVANAVCGRLGLDLEVAELTGEEAGDLPHE